MAVLPSFHPDNGGKFFKVFGGSDPLLTIKRGVAHAARILGTDALKLYALPVREIIQWCDVAHEIAQEVASNGGHYT